MVSEPMGIGWTYRVRLPLISLSRDGTCDGRRGDCRRRGGITIAVKKGAASEDYDGEVPGLTIYADEEVSWAAGAEGNGCSQKCRSFAAGFAVENLEDLEIEVETMGKMLSSR